MGGNRPTCRWRRLLVAASDPQRCGGSRRGLGCSNIPPMARLGRWVSALPSMSLLQRHAKRPPRTGNFSRQVRTRLLSSTKQEKVSRAKAARPARSGPLRKWSPDFLAAHSPGGQNFAHRQQWHSTLKIYAFPVIGSRAVSDISTDDILKILTPIWHAKPETAGRLRGRIERVLSAARTRGFRSGENPVRWKDHLENLLR